MRGNSNVFGRIDRVKEGGENCLGFKVDYRNPGTITKRYQTAVEKIQLAWKCRLIEDRFKEIENKRDAANATYETLQWAMKYHIYKRMGNKDKGRIKGEYIDLSQLNNPRLIDLMIKHAQPQLNSPQVHVNIDILNRLMLPVRNNPTHSGAEPDFEGLGQMIVEVGKLTSIYVDSKLECPAFNFKEPEVVQNWEFFYHTCNRFDVCGRFYVLVIGPSQDVPKEYLKIIGNTLPWSLVFDFDQFSRNNGAYFACYADIDDSPHEITILNAEKQKFSRYAAKKYWFYANGLNGVNNTHFKRPRDWEDNYDDKIKRMLTNFAAEFIGPVTAVILWDSDKHIKRICAALYAKLQSRVEFVFASKNNAQLSEIIDDYDGVPINISISEIAEGLIRYNPIDKTGADLNRLRFVLPHHESVTGLISLEDYQNFFEDFDLLHEGIGHETTSLNEERNQFFRGQIISWNGLRNHCDVERKRAIKLRRTIEKKLSMGESKVFYLIHSPGAGGTTIARRIAWDIHHDHPVLVLKNYRDRYTADNIIKIAAITKKSVLVVVECYLFNIDYLHRMVDYISSQMRPVVFLFVKRGEHGSSYLKSGNGVFFAKLDNQECYDFVSRYESILPELYEPKDVFRKKKTLESICSGKDIFQRNPFYMALEAFEQDFVGLKEYIMKFIEQISTDIQRKIVLYMALIHKYTSRALPAYFFNNIVHASTDGSMEKVVIQLEKYLPAGFDALLINEDDNNIAFWRPRHILFSDMLVRILMATDPDIPENWKLHLSDWAITFIEDTASISGTIPQYIMDILRELFILRSTDEINDEQFSSLISDIPYSTYSRERIFKKLVETYPDDPHFRAHFARYYSIEAKNYEQALIQIYEAIYLSQLQENDDSTLYHIRGMCMGKQAREKMCQMERQKRNGFDINLQDIEEVKTMIDDAGEQYQKSRDLSNEEHGYVSHIKLLLQVVDFGWKMSDFASRVEFLTHQNGRWYREALDKSENLLETVKRLKKDSGVNRYIAECDGLAALVYEDYGATLQAWNSVLDGSEDPSARRMARRSIVRTYLRRDKSFASMQLSIIRRILNLMEDNIREEKNAEQNINLWFQAARFDPSIDFNDAINKLSIWRAYSDSQDVVYYQYVLNVLKALEGSIQAREEAKRLIKESSIKASRLPNRTYCHEWLGKGQGLMSLVSSKAIDLDCEDDPRTQLDGVFVEYEHPGAGFLEIDGLRVFFRPSQGNDGLGLSQTDLNKDVTFKMGFSYDGLRAEDVKRKDFLPARKDATGEKTSESITNFGKEDTKEGVLNENVPQKDVDLGTSTKKIAIGQIVKFIVTGIGAKHVYGRIQITQEQASIYIGEISDTYVTSIGDYIEIGEVLTTKVIGFSDKWGWGLSLRALKDDKKKKNTEHQRDQLSYFGEKLKRALEKGGNSTS